MKYRKIYFWIAVLLGFLILTSSRFSAEKIYRTQSGKVYFISKAPLEVIEAQSESLKGVIDGEKRIFAFSIPIRSFTGFNNPLQQEHFNENYIESQRFPNASFSGKIIEKIDFSQEGKWTVRAKGQLDIHGVVKERIIKSQLEIRGNKLLVQSDFTILLQEHGIRVPKIVHQKIAEEIAVHIEAELS